ncbi:MAG: AAA family ATPase [Gemmatimonadetes bacterium]|nr:AAA family ATPase [Gemmatimonadota bacterium]
MTGSNGARPAARFLAIELSYGRHHGVFDLEVGTRPVVIAGPNGAGKSSLIEAIIRALYGFRRSRADDRTAHSLRRPWSGGSYGARLVLETGAGRWTIERDFDTDAVRIVEAGRESPLFEGEAKPKGAGESARRYRALLTESVGLSELDPYARTACIFQGGIGATGLNLDLLRVAAGGHTDVESAHGRLRKEYRALTTEPIDGGARRRRKLGSIERLDRRIDDLETRTVEAVAAEDKRGPLVRERDEVRAEIERLVDAQAALEAAFEVLSEARRLEEAETTSRDRLRRLERSSRELDEALARFDLSRDRITHGPAARYPLDFPERARALEEGVWPRRSALEEELDTIVARPQPTGRAAAVIGAIGLAALGLGAIALTLGGRVLGGALLGLGGTAGLVALARRRTDLRAARDRGDRIRALETQLDEVTARAIELLDGVPDPETLTPESLPGRRAEYERETADRAVIEESDRALRQAVDLATRELSGLDSGAEGPSARDTTGGLTVRARDALGALHAAAASERERTLAPLTLRLGELGRVRFDLPAGVDATLDGVRDARRVGLAAGERARARLVEIDRRLAVEARPEDSVQRLRRELDAARTEHERRSRRANAYRVAFRLVSDAYESFRRTDEKRLLEAVTRHLTGVSGGELGALSAQDGLEDARIALGEREVPIEAPPLSYGQLHTALLSIRMGAADFLAGLGVRVPLLIDDPFVHLDEEAASELWRILQRVARERQVIIATQDRLLLEHLGVTADIGLERASERPDDHRLELLPARDGPTKDGSEDAAAAVDDELDLFSS